MQAKITSITGLQNLINLQTFIADNNSLTTIDLSGLTNLTYVELSSNNIISVDNITWPSSLEELNLGYNQIVNFNPITALPSGLQQLYLNGNQIVTFNPSITLPNSLEQLSLYDNQIVTFNPTLALPNSLTSLFLNANQMTTAGYTASEPWANAMSVIPGRGNIYIGGNVNSASGTNLETILIAKGWTVYS